MNYSREYCESCLRCGLRVVRSLRSRLTQLALLQVLFDAFGFAKQEWNVSIGKLDEFGDVSDVVLEFLDEFLIFLVAPRSSEARELSHELRRALLQVAVELLER